MDRRTFLTGTTTVATAALAGCQSNTNQDTNSDDTQNNTGEFSIEEFLVGEAEPEQYEAEFIAGNNPEEVADQLTPELSYQIEGTNEEVQTEVQFEYSDQTIPDGEPLNTTVQGKTHQGSGQYTQTLQLPDNLVSEIIQNPKNIQATFTATDKQTGETQTQEYDLNFADSFAEQIINEAYAQDRISAENEKVNVEDGTISIDYQIDSEIGTFEFNKETASVAGVYTGIVDLTRTAYDLEINVKDSNGEKYEKSISDNLAENYLNNEITEDQFNNQLTFNKLKT